MSLSNDIITHIAGFLLPQDWAKMPQVFRGYFINDEALMALFSCLFPKTHANFIKREDYAQLAKKYLLTTRPLFIKLPKFWPKAKLHDDSASKSFTFYINAAFSTTPTTIRITGPPQSCPQNIYMDFILVDDSDYKKNSWSWRVKVEQFYLARSFIIIHNDKEITLITPPKVYSCHHKPKYGRKNIILITVDDPTNIRIYVDAETPIEPLVNEN